MALKKFKKARGTPSIEDFPAMAKTIYHTTESPQDPLRKEFLTLLMTDWSVWLATDNFANFLSVDAASHEFAMDVIIALVQHLIAKSRQDQSSTEAQATANRLLLSDLDQANEALAKSSHRIRALETDLAAAKAENTKLEMDVQSQTTAARLLQSDLDQANKEVARSKSGLRKLEAENPKLEVDLKNSRDTTEKYREKVSTAQAQFKDANEKLKSETAKANRTAEQCNRNLIACKEKDRTILAKDKIIATEKAKADKGMSIIRSIVLMVNNHGECRNCGEGLNYTLQPDDRVIKVYNKDLQPFNSMLRCYNCKCKEYGDLITLL
jgi:DNA repair exonuclease SbcCD ATPase subunit